MKEITSLDRLAPIDLFGARRIGLLALLGGLTLTCAGVSAADTVRVTNPATEPVLTSRVDEPARVPYQVQLGGTSGNSCESLVSTITCGGRINGVPAGKRLVVQSISGSLIANSAPTSGQILVATESNSAGYFGVPSISNLPNIIVIPGQLPFADGASNVFFQSHVVFYLDGGVPAQVYVSLSGATSGDRAVITVTGYVIDCTAAPCVPIVTQ